MISATAVYTDCSDRINVEENGQFSYSMFNRFGWLGQLSLLDWLSGDVKGIEPPEPYRTQKLRDYLSPFVVKYPFNVSDESMTRPDDYYLYQDLYRLTGKQDCDSLDEINIIKKPIDLLSNDKFNIRANTNIKSLKPENKAIAKQVGKTFEFLPKGIGSVTLEYIRYPKMAFLSAKKDNVYNQLIPDEDSSINFEWDEFARGILVWYIVDSFSNRNREQSLKSFNNSTGKTTRDGKF